MERDRLATKPSGTPWLGEVPAHWEVKRMRFSAPHSNERIEADGNDALPYVGMEHIESWTGQLLPLDEEFVPTGISNCMRPGQVLFGKLRPYLAKAWVADRSGLCSTELMVLDAQQYQPDFLRYLMLTDGFIKLVDSSTQGAKMPRADWEFVGNIALPLPPLPEQRAIATFLDERTARIDGLLARKRRLVQLLKEKRQALITRAVTRGLDAKVKLKESGVPWLGQVPVHWEVKRLKRISEFITSGSRGWAEHYADEGAVFIRIGNLDRTSIDLRLDDIQRVDPPTSAELIRTRALPGDLLISITAFLGTIGLVPVGLGDAYVNQHTALIRLQHARCYPRFVAYWFASSAAQQQFESASQGGTKEGMNLQEVRDLITLQPSYAEQKRIADALDASLRKLDAMVTKVEAAMERLQEYRTALISAAVTGKVRVPAPLATSKA